MSTPPARCPQANLDRMANTYGFFLPDSEYCVDVPGLLGYCAEKVKLGHYCLFCQRTFSSAMGCMRHMVDSGHTKLRYEEGVDLEEFEVFYDFTEANEEYLRGVEGKGSKGERAEGGGEGEGEEDWSDVDRDIDDEDYDSYHENIKRAGFSVNHLGELVLPSGKVREAALVTRALRYFAAAAPS